jgi:hypothetical protein
MENSTFGRLIGVLFAPGKTFRAIAESPTWLAAFLVVALSPLVPSILAAPKMDWEGIIKGNMERMDVQVPQEQLDQQIEITKKIGGAMTYMFPVVLAILMLIIALVMWGAFTLAGGQPGYVRSLAVTAHAFMPLALSSLLSIPVILGLSTIGPEIAETGTYLFSNPAVFAPDGTGPVLMAFLSKIDLFTIWIVILLAIGFHHAAKVKARTAGITVVALWLVLWVGISVGFAALGAMMAGRASG